jgi:putative membrane protein
MRINENHEPSRLVLIAALSAAVAVLVGCSTSREQPPLNADANASAAQPAAQPTAQVAKAKAAATVPSPEVSSKKTNAAILERIHLANLKEIEAGKLAETKASSSEVRAYADQLIKDHTSADQMVVATAQKMGARLRDPSTERRKTANGKQAEQKLSSANGAQFDRLFLEQSSADHKKLMTELKQARDDASDDDIEALIDKIMPILQQHQDLAEILMKKEPA